MRSSEDPDDFLYKKDWCCNCLKPVTPKEGPSDRQYEDIILQCLPPEDDNTHQIHLEKKDCNLVDIWRMMSKITPTTLPVLISIRQKVLRDAVSSCKRRGGTTATQNATTMTSSTPIRTSVPTSRQTVSRTSDADNGSTSSEADISCISRR